MKNHLILLVAAFISMVLFSACFGSKKIKNTVAAEKAAIEKISAKLQQNSFEPNWFKAKMKIEAGGQGQNQHFNAEIRLRKDSLMWVSIYPPMVKIEVARILISPDSIKLIDRFNKKYYAKDVSYIKQFIDYPLEFETLQNIILGNPLIACNETTSLIETDDSFCLSTKEAQLDSKISLDKKAYTIAQMNIADTKSLQNLTANYTDYNEVQGKTFSYLRDINLSTPETYMATIKFSKVETNETLAFPFSVSKKYERVK
jgi:outer membrane lipoprotein-sorting protein